MSESKIEQLIENSLVEKTWSFFYRDAECVVKRTFVWHVHFTFNHTSILTEACNVYYYNDGMFEKLVHMTEDDGRTKCFFSLPLQYKLEHVFDDLVIAVDAWYKLNE